MVLLEVLGENHFSCLFQLLASTVWLGSRPVFQISPPTPVSSVTSLPIIMLGLLLFSPHNDPSIPWFPACFLLQSQQQESSPSYACNLSCFSVSYFWPILEDSPLLGVYMMGLATHVKFVIITLENPGYSPDLKILSQHLSSPFCRIICRFQELRCGLSH